MTRLWLKNENAEHFYLDVNFQLDELDCEEVELEVVDLEDVDEDVKEQLYRENHLSDAELNES